MISKFISLKNMYITYSIKDFIIPSGMIAVNRLMKVVIMVVPLQFVLLIGGSHLPQTLSNIIPKEASISINYILVAIIISFFFLLLMYAYVHYKSNQLKPLYLNQKNQEFSEITKVNKQAKGFFSRVLHVQSDMMLNVFCLIGILIFNIHYFFFCSFILVFALYLFDEILTKKLVNNKNISFYSEIYSMIMYIMMIAFLSYGAYQNNSNLLHIVPIFFVSRMMVVSIPRLTKNIYVMNRSNMF
ncbi:hypothetical protein DA100_15695 [Vibrio sp. Hep-1b-8]|nr:hypothetical protein DA100_15695 [Vibrio sp. Hep-1b-8]